PTLPLHTTRPHPPQLGSQRRYTTPPPAKPELRFWRRLPPHGQDLQRLAIVPALPSPSRAKLSPGAGRVRSPEETPPGITKRADFRGRTRRQRSRFHPAE